MRGVGEPDGTIPPVKIGDAAWMETLRDAVTPECDGEVRAVGLLWAVGLEQAINAYAARRISNATAYDSADVGMQHQGLPGMPDASGLATHIALAVTDDFVHAFEPKYKVSMLGRAKPPEIKHELAGWPREGLTVTVGAPENSSVLGYRVEGRRVVLDTPATGERHELTIGVAPHDDEFLSVLTAS
jgi:hypothetical protein